MRAAGLPAEDPLHGQLEALADSADGLRTKIVATKEGGAITGEERYANTPEHSMEGSTATKGAPPTKKSLEPKF